MSIPASLSASALRLEAVEELAHALCHVASPVGVLVEPTARPGGSSRASDDARHGRERAHVERRLEPDRVGDHAQHDGCDAAEADREADREARGQADLPRQVLLRQHDRDAEGADGAGADQGERDGSRDAADGDEDEDQRRHHGDAAAQHQPAAVAVGERAEHEGADPAGQEHQCEQPPARGLRVAERDLPERHEHEQAEPRSRPERDDAEQVRHRPGAVDAVGDAPDDLLRDEPAQIRLARDQDERPRRAPGS